MRILLVYPAFPQDTFWGFDRALQLSGRRSTMPPLGLLTVAGAFPAARHDISLVDENVRPVEDAELAAADLVLSSAMVVQRAGLAALIERCGRLGVRIAVGGPLVSACYADLAREGLRPTSWCIGEAEPLLADFVADAEAGRLLPAYAHAPDQPTAASVRAAFGPQARIVVGARPAIDDAPAPRFDLVDFTDYHAMPLQFSRGCPVGCEFCDIWKQFGLVTRTGAPDRFVRQLDHLFALGWRGRIFVVDDNFIGKVAATRELLLALRAWQRGPKRFRVPAEHCVAIGTRRLRRLRARSRRGRLERYPFALCTEADVRVGREGPGMAELRSLLVEAGFGSLFLGIETPSAAALREAGKRVNIGSGGHAEENLVASVHRIQEAGLEVMGGFIVGFDHDPAEIDRAMPRFLERAGIPVAMVGLLAVVPGSALEERLRREGRLKRCSDGTNTHSLSLDFEPVGRSEAEVVAQYVGVLDAAFGDGMRGYYARCEALLSRLPRPPRTGERVGWRELRALVRSLFALRPLGAYLRFLLRTLLRRPRFLGVAVVLAIQGHHLHALTMRCVERHRSSTPTAASSRAARVRALEESRGAVPA